jgi:hypothetical protein
MPKDAAARAAKEPHAPSAEIFKARWKQYLKVWNDRLARQKYCAGEEMTIADISLYACYARAKASLPELCEGFPHVARWAGEMGARPDLLFNPVLRALPRLIHVGARPGPQYAESLPERQTGWLAALRDPVLAKVLVLLHAQPEQPWTVTQLARRSAVSRSVLAERFRERSV